MALTNSDLDAISKWALKKSDPMLRSECKMCAMPGDIAVLVSEIRFLRSELMDRGVTEKELDNHD